MNRRAVGIIIKQKLKNATCSDNQKIMGQNEVENVRKKKGKNELGRNDPCWCGSGKKYKKCHGAQG